MLSDIKLFKPGFLTPAMGSNDADSWEMPEDHMLMPLTSSTSVAATPSTLNWDDDALAQKQQQQQHLLQQQLQVVQQEQKTQEQLEASRHDAAMKHQQHLQEQQQLQQQQQQLQQQQQQHLQEQQQLQQQQQQQQNDLVAQQKAKAAGVANTYFMHGNVLCWTHGSSFCQVCPDCISITDMYDACAEAHVDAPTVYHEQKEQRLHVQQQQLQQQQQHLQEQQQLQQQQTQLHEQVQVPETAAETAAR